MRYINSIKTESHIEDSVGYILAFHIHSRTCGLHSVFINTLIYMPIHQYLIYQWQKREIL